MYTGGMGDDNGKAIVQALHWARAEVDRSTIRAALAGIVAANSDVVYPYACPPLLNFLAKETVDGTPLAAEAFAAVVSIRPELMCQATQIIQSLPLVPAAEDGEKIAVQKLIGAVFDPGLPYGHGHLVESVGLGCVDNDTDALWRIVQQRLVDGANTSAEERLIALGNVRVIVPHLPQHVRDNAFEGDMNHLFGIPARDGVTRDIVRSAISDNKEESDAGLSAVEAILKSDLRQALTVIAVVEPGFSKNGRLLGGVEDTTPHSERWLKKLNLLDRIAAHSFANTSKVLDMIEIPFIHTPSARHAGEMIRVMTGIVEREPATGKGEEVRLAVRRVTDLVLMAADHSEDPARVAQAMPLREAIAAKSPDLLPRVFPARPLQAFVQEFANARRAPQGGVAGGPE